MKGKCFGSCSNRNHWNKYTCYKYLNVNSKGHNQEKGISEPQHKTEYASWVANLAALGM